MFVMTKIRYALRIRGRVQGVSFRASARELAEELGLTGWVRNDPDDSVVCEVEGEPRHVLSFRFWCESGPMGADVTELEEGEIPTQEDLDFRIL